MANKINETTGYLTEKNPALIDRVSRKMVFGLLESLKTGHLRVLDPTTGTHDFGDTNSPFKATLQIDDPVAYREIALGGSVGSGDAYGSGYWSTPDLVQLLRLFVKNLSVVDSMERGVARLFTGFLKT